MRQLGTAEAVAPVVAQTTSEPSSPEWALAEEAFLANLTQKTVFDHGVTFTSEHSARRMNSLRILEVDRLDTAGWRAALDRHAREFERRRVPLSLQLADPSTPDRLPGDWLRIGPVLVHVATHLADFGDASSIPLRLTRVSSEDDIRAFVDMTIPDRVPEPLRETARPGVLRAVRAFAADERVAIMLAYDGDALVGQVVASGTATGYTVSNLTVVPSHRGRGYMKAIYAALSRTFEGQLYGQIIEGVATLAFRNRFPSTRRLATTRTYQRADDPFREIPRPSG